MSKINVVFNSNAFGSEEEKNTEIARIFRELADLAEMGQLAERNIRDVNDNVIGHYAEIDKENAEIVVVIEGSTITDVMVAGIPSHDIELKKFNMDYFISDESLEELEEMKKDPSYKTVY